MSQIAYWLATRSVLAVGAAPLAYGLVTEGMARAAACALVALAAVAFVIAARRSRTLFSAGADPEVVGGRVGLAFNGVDYAIILTLAWFVPLDGLPGLGLSSGLYPGPVLVKVLVLLSVAHVWLRVMRSAQPVRAIEVLHPAMIIAAGLASWFVVDRSLPSGAGQEQAALSVIVAGLSVACALAVWRMSVRLESRVDERTSRPRTA